MSQFGVAEIEDDMIAEAIVVKQSYIGYDDGHFEEIVRLEMFGVVVEHFYQMHPGEIFRKFRQRHKCTEKSKKIIVVKNLVLISYLM